MKKFFIAIIFLISNSLWAASQAAPLTLAFQSKVSVHAGGVTLGDLLLKEKTSPEIIQRFAGVSLEGVQGGILQASHVLNILSRQGLDLDNVSLLPPSQIEVVFEKEEVKEVPAQSAEIAKETEPVPQVQKSFLKKGDVVSLVLSNKSFQIRAVGKVKEVQENGNRVLVENTDSKKEVWGQAISESEVQVAF